MIKRDGTIRQRGFVRRDGTGFVFESTRGEVFRIMKDAQAEKLANSHEMCILESVTSKNPEEKFGKIVEVIGSGLDVKTLTRAIGASFGFHSKFQTAVEEEAKRIPDYVRESDTKGFADRRNIPFVTIDPDTAKDYDDAVWACKNSDGTYTLKVAIANVAYYVNAGSALFNEAKQRGNSNYLGDIVYPMLPEKLSNGICSINEGVDRLAMLTSCVVAPDGALRSYSMEPAVIRSHHRLTYKEADYIHFGENASGDTDDHKGIIARTFDVKDSLDALLEVSEILRNARMRRGALDIPEREYEFTYSADGKRIVDFATAHNEKYTSVIEETAILTNEIGGYIATILDLPFIYRNHKFVENRDQIKLAQNDLKKFGIKMPSTPTGKNLQKIINDVKGKRNEDYVIKTTLSTMTPAMYSLDNEGHIGLAISCPKPDRHQNNDPQSRIDEARERYLKLNGSCHGLSFEGDIEHIAYGPTTSPIRRSADTCNQSLFMHMIMKGQIPIGEQQLEEVIESGNYNERISKQAESDCNDMLFASWAREYVGEPLEGCYIIDMGQKEAKVRSPKGLTFWVPYKYIDCERQYIKIGRVLKSLTISDVKVNPPKITAVPTEMYRQWSDGRKNAIEQSMKQ